MAYSSDYMGFIAANGVNLKRVYNWNEAHT